VKLYLLKRRGFVPAGQNAGFVVRAETRARARELACAKATDFDRDEPYGDDPSDVWLDPSMSTCEGIDPDGPEGVVLRDHRGES
jgi:hypothetical protein